MAQPPEPDWRTATNPDVLLNIVLPRPLPYAATTAARELPAPLARRLRLFGVGCALLVWDMLATDTRNSVILSEGCADGRLAVNDLGDFAVRMMYGPVTFQQQAMNAAGWASAGFWGGRGRVQRDPEQMVVWNPAEAAREAAKALATRAAGPAPADSHRREKWHAAWNTTFAEARAHQAELVRDIFPPPGYAPVLRPDWETSTVVALARQMDDTGDFSAVPILADALQDAGCDDDIMLDRCRAGSGVHCRGNWVVDLVLGRE